MNLPYIIILAAAIVLLLILVILQIRTRSEINELRRNGHPEDISRQLAEMQVAVIKELNAGERNNERAFYENFEKLSSMMSAELQQNTEARAKSELLLRRSLLELTETMDRKLANIQDSVTRQLDSSLNERLDENFRQVSERLESLYKSLGELKRLETGLTSLNRTLSNVKTRGVFGELQLGNILADIFDASQYDTNVATYPASSEYVEFAVKIPDKETPGKYIYLPIDSKFPSDLYNKIVDASDAADRAALEQARKELKNRIRIEAMSIRDKYIHIPETTDFAIMFIPTESLYAEILRIPGLAEYCQKRCRIIIAGPMTLTALLNSLAVGFKYLSVNSKTEEILRSLGAFKTQFEKYDELIIAARKNLEAAQNKTEKIQQRNALIRKSLRGIDALGFDESQSVLLSSATDPESED